MLSNQEFIIEHTKYISDEAYCLLSFILWTIENSKKDHETVSLLGLRNRLFNRFGRRPNEYEIEIFLRELAADGLILRESTQSQFKITFTLTGISKKMVGNLKKYRPCSRVPRVELKVIAEAAETESSVIEKVIEKITLEPDEEEIEEIASAISPQKAVCEAQPKITTQPLDESRYRFQTYLMSIAGDKRLGLIPEDFLPMSFEKWTNAGMPTKTKL
jgi:hypothetical protein